MDAEMLQECSGTHTFSRGAVDYRVWLLAIPLSYTIATYMLPQALATCSDVD